MGHIVCAIRGGQGSLAVRRLAIRLACQRESRLTFLSVVDVDTLLARSEKLKAAARAELRWTVDVLLRIAVQHAAEEQVESAAAIREGPVRETIEAFVREVGADLLLLGAPRGTTANLFGDDAIEQFARQIHDDVGVEVRVARPELV